MIRYGMVNKCDLLVMANMTALTVYATDIESTVI